jgi:NADH-quinone oxidoreductase subunit H
MTVSVYLVAVIDGAVATRVSHRGRYSKIWLSPLARAARLALQRRSATERPDREAWALAPPLLFGLAAVALTAIPFAPGVEIADVGAGIVLFGAAMVQVMVAVFLHGWGSNSVFPMIGAFRMAAATLSMGIPFSLVLITTALPAESLSVGMIISSQENLWNVLRQPLGLPIYLITALAFSFWGPMQLPDGADLAGGTAAESSGMPLLAWRIGRAAVLVALSAMGAAAFLGGYLGPWIPGWLWMFAKTAILATLMIWAGHRLARIRMESVVVFGWTVLLPVALVDVFVSGALTL